MRIRIHWVVIPLLICGTLATSGLAFEKDVNVHSNRPKAIIQQNVHIEQALNHLGKQSHGEAQLVYYRHGHLLAFSVNDYNYRNKFEGQNLQNQIDYFTRKTGVNDVDPQVEITAKAMRHHKVQVDEQKKQRKENHREVQQLIKQAKERAKKAREKKKAKAKAKKEAQQRAKQKAEQRKAQQKREARQKAIQRKIVQQKKRAELNAQKAKRQKQNQARHSRFK